MSEPVFIKTTEDGRRVEVLGGWVCLAGEPEADRLVGVQDHPNREAIARVAPEATHMAGRLTLTHEQALRAQQALQAAQVAYDESPAGIAQRLRQAAWDRARTEGVE